MSLPRRVLPRLLVLVGWLMLALPGLLALVPAEWPGVAALHRLVAAEPPRAPGLARPSTIEPAWEAWRAGRLQAALSRALQERLVGRALAVRATYQLYYDLFDRSQSSGTDILVGRDQTLFEGNYVRAYCSSLRPDRRDWATAFVAQAGTLAAELRRRGGALLVVIGPSKAHVQPAALRTTRCRHDPAQEALRRDFVAQLRGAGVRVLDGTAIALRHARQDPLPPFPRGGIHWSLLLQDLVAQRALATLAAESGVPLGALEVGAIDWTAPPAPPDADLALLLNLLRPPLDYPTARAPVTCRRTAEGAARRLIIVGTSFSEGLLHRLALCAPFAEIRFFSYYRNWQRQVAAGVAVDLLPRLPVPAGPELWRELLADRPLLLLEVHELLLYDGSDYFQALGADLEAALRPPE